MHGSTPAQCHSRRQSQKQLYQRTPASLCPPLDRNFELWRPRCSPKICDRKRRGELHQPSTTAMSRRLRIRMTDHPQRTIFFGVELEILMSKVVEQNTLKRRGVGLRACNPERACPGFTLFTPRFEQNRTVYLIDLQGEVVHTWHLPYAPFLFG